jgi:hypothetical protein
MHAQLAAATGILPVATFELMTKNNTHLPKVSRDVPLGSRLQILDRVLQVADGQREVRLQQEDPEPDGLLQEKTVSKEMFDAGDLCR